MPKCVCAGGAAALCTRALHTRVSLAHTLLHTFLCPALHFPRQMRPGQSYYLYDGQNEKLNFHLSISFMHSFQTSGAWSTGHGCAPRRPAYAGGRLAGSAAARKLPVSTRANSSEKALAAWLSLPEGAERPSLGTASETAPGPISDSGSITLP